MLLCLTLCVACSSKVVPVPVVVEKNDPTWLLEATPMPVCRPLETNADLLDCTLDTRAALTRCNADKAAAKRSMEGGD